MPTIGNNLWETLVTLENNSKNGPSAIRAAMTAQYNAVKSQVESAIGADWHTQEEYLKSIAPGTTPTREKFNLFKELSKGFQKLVGLAGKVIKAPVLAALLPLKSSMKKKLNEKGVTYSNKIDDIANKFYKKVIKSQSYEEYNVDVAAAAATGGASIPLDLLVPAIVEFFKTLLGKAKDGALSQADELWAKYTNDNLEKFDTSATYREQLENEEKSAQNSINGGGGNSDLFIILIVIVGLVVLAKVFGK